MLKFKKFDFRKWTGSLSHFNFSSWNWMGMLAEIMGQVATICCYCMYSVTRTGILKFIARLFMWYCKS